MGNSEAKVATKFNQVASHYDEQRRQLIPCFNDFYSLSVSLLHPENDAPNILDVGAGTGLLSGYILDKFPEARLTLIDISEQMLDEARVRFANNPNVNYVFADYTKCKFEGTFDAIVSSLSIHHLEDAAKMKLYKTLYERLVPGGVFINADQVLGETPFIEKLYKNDWKTKVEASGLSEEEIRVAYERTKLDKMAPLANQLSWLQEAGYTDVDCIYKYFNFVILFGRKMV